jgi:nucleotidyltransferase substrate binding protein (TIGR01987 family)
MNAIDYSSLDAALKALAIGFEEHAAHPELLTVRDGVIQRFEIAMDLGWKLLARTLRVKLQVEETEILTKKDIFRHAAKFGLIEDASAWFGHYDARNESSHMYDADVAQATFERAKLYLGDAMWTLQKLVSAQGDSDASSQL